MGYIGICGPKGYDFLAVLVRNRVWILHSSLDLGMFFRGSYSFSMADSPQMCVVCFWAKGI